MGKKVSQMFMATTDASKVEGSVVLRGGGHECEGFEGLGVFRLSLENAI